MLAVEILSARRVRRRERPDLRPHRVVPACAGPDSLGRLEQQLADTTSKLTLLAAQTDLRNFIGNETEPAAYFFEQLDISLAIVSKARAATEINLFGMQAIQLTTSRRKSSARICENALVEMNDDCLFDSEDAQGFDLSDQNVCSSGGADSGCRTARGCGSNVITVGTAPIARAALHDGFHDELMAEMQTVEHPERQDSRAARFRRFRFRGINA